MNNESIDDFFGKPLKRTEKLKVCIHPECTTILNPYRAVENDVCSIHHIWLTEEEDKKRPNHVQTYYYKHRDRLLRSMKERRDRKRRENGNS